jgi:hypothetical protein
MNSPSPPPARPVRDWWVILGMTITALSAATSSFSGLQSLAEATGWPEPLSFLLPFTIDAYAMTATRVWLSSTTRSARARRFARWNAVLAIGLSLIGNALWHLIAAEVLTVTWPIVVLVGAVPPAVLGLLSHLAVLRGHGDPLPASSIRPAEPVTTPGPSAPAPRVITSSTPPHPAAPKHQDRPEDGITGKDGHAEIEPEPDNEDHLLVAARAADAAHRARHGKPITRDELRKALRVSTERATSLLRAIKENTSNYR